MKGLPPEVRWIVRAVASAEDAEVLLGDLQEEAGTRFRGRPVARGLWLRWETLRSVAALTLDRRTAGKGRDGVRPDGRTETRMTTRPGGGGMGMRAVIDDLRFALLGLRRSPAFTLFAAGTLALGVGSATAVYSAVERVILNPLPYPGAERMVSLWRSTDGEVVFFPELRVVEAWAELDVFEEIAYYQGRQPTLTGRGDPETIRTKGVSRGYLDLLDATPRLGRSFAPDDHRGDGARVALLSHEFWTERFGRDEGVLGRTLRLDDEPWTVVGVLPPRVYPPNSGPGLTDVWTPLGEAVEGSVWPLALLRRGATVEEANARLDGLAEAAPAAGLGPPADWRGRAFAATSFGRGSVAETLRTLSLAVALLLLVAAVNVSNLLFQRATDRRQETAIRAALGAGRWRLLRQLVFESMLLGGVAAVLGLALAWGGLAVVEARRPETMAWLLDGLRIDGRVLLFSIAVATAAGLAASLLPALALGRSGRRGSLLRGRSHGESGGDRSSTRWALVAGEVALSFALITGTVTVIGALADLHSRDPGFRTEGLVAIEVELPAWRYEEEADRRALFRTLEAEVARTPGVEAAAVVDAIPPGLPGRVARLHPEGREPEEQSTYVRHLSAAPGILELLGQPLLAGRDLRPGDEEDAARPAVVGLTLGRRLFPETPPQALVGRRFAMGADEEPLTIVGVAADVLSQGLAYEPGLPLVYRPRLYWPRMQTLAVRLADGIDGEAWASSSGVRRRVLERAPEAVVRVGTAESAMADSLVRERFTTLLLTSFAALALLLAAVGMYGVVSRAVTGRTREIGIRMSLGADRGAVRRLILRGGAGATLAGIAAGAGLAWLGLRFLSSGIFGLGGDRPSAYLVAGAVLGCVALLATWLPARRAARLDPSIAMRSE